MTFSKHLVKKGVLNMSHLHITKIQQKEKKVSYKLSVWKVWGCLRDVTVPQLSSRKHTINLHFRNCYCCL